MHLYLVLYFVSFQVEEEPWLCGIHESDYNPIMTSMWTKTEWYNSVIVEPPHRRPSRTEIKHTFDSSKGVFVLLSA